MNIINGQIKTSYHDYQLCTGQIYLITIQYQCADLKLGPVFLVILEVSYEKNMSCVVCTARYIVAGMPAFSIHKGFCG